MLKNIKLTTKIIITVFTAITSMLIISASTYFGLTKIGMEIEEIADYQVPINTLITELEKDILEEEILTYQLIIESKDIHSEKFIGLQKEIHLLEKQSDKAIQDAENLVQEAINHNKDDKTRASYQLFFDELKELEEKQGVFKKLLLQFEKRLEHTSIDKMDKEKDLLHHELDLMDKDIVQLMQQMEKLLEHSTHQAKMDEIMILRTIEIIVIIALIITSLLSWFIVKNIKITIHNFQEGVLGFFKYLNRQSTEVTLLDASSKDEIGIMAQVVNENIQLTKQSIDEDRQVIDDAIRVLSEFEQGDLCQRVSVESSNPTLKELTHLLNQMGINLEKNIDNILDVLEEYSQYNYINKLSEDGLKKHLLKLTKGINSLGDAITTMLCESKSNGLTMKTNAQTLVNNVNLLNNNSTNTATALEETAAALEEITATIAKNSDTIAKMNEHANTVKHSVTNSEEHANSTNESMDKLYTQVNAINDAVVFIDQIAFQTNILSLNAAVEAATAGEAGKGFAVVAGEVRNLATRAADTAKEIKELVENATEQAQAGKDIANTMIDEYSTLFKTIEENGLLIDHVAQASKEQQGGIEQINEAVTELDRQSQQNLSIAHSTQSIAEESDSLSSMIVHDANAKEFRGKDDVKCKNMEGKTKPIVTPTQPTQMAKAKPLQKETKIVTDGHVFTSDTKDEGQWESF